MNAAKWKNATLGIFALAAAIAAAFSAGAGAPQNSAPPRKKAPHRNVIIFVADGLRHVSVNPTDAPTMYRIETQGVAFANSHSLFPTFTTANASAIATGHYLGDTGDFSNTIFVGYATFSSHDFGRKASTPTPFIESDPVLGDLDGHFDGNYLHEETLLALARTHGFQTAAIGKTGPAAIQDISQLDPQNGGFPAPATIFIDDSTGSADGIPLSPEVETVLKDAGLRPKTPARDQPAGTNTTPGTRTSNAHQQQYFADAATKAILPMFKKHRTPFVLLYWSRDPDGTQHNQGDSLNRLSPGINGPTSKLGIRDADNNLKQILDYVQSDPELAANTDILITSDHGFATVSHREIDAQRDKTSSYASKFTYRDTAGHEEIDTGSLPSGFLALDLAHFLALPLYDPDTQIDGPEGKKVYEPVDPTIPQQTAKMRQHPANANGLIGGGDGLIGGSGQVTDQTDAEVIVAANGGSDLIYLPAHDPALAKKIVSFLAEQDYVGGLFVDDQLGKIPGALPMESIRLEGSTKLPQPSIVVSFKTFALDPHDPLRTAIQVSDTSLQEGQGMHGGFGRNSTFNFMAAIGPDFKKRFADPAPVSNADIAPTLAKILNLKLESTGKLTGRALEEALAGGPVSVPYRRKTDSSDPAANGERTILEYQQAGNRVYFDRACFVKAAPAISRIGSPRCP